MMSALFSWPVLFSLIAIGMSVFYGLRACEIFSVSTIDRKTSWRFHQFWLNFLGSGVGWVAAWAVLRATVECASSDCALSVTPSAVSLFFLAFVGVTGYLPATIVGAIGGINEFISKLLTLIGGKP